MPNKATPSLAREERVRSEGGAARAAPPSSMMTMMTMMSSDGRRCDGGSKVFNAGCTSRAGLASRDESEVE